MLTDNPFGGDRDSFGEFLIFHTSRGLLIGSTLLCAVVGFVLGGFIYGAVFRPPYTGFHDRLVWGVFWGFLSIITRGNPPLDEGGVGHTTTWPLILLSWGALLFAWHYGRFRLYKRAKRAI